MKSPCGDKLAYERFATSDSINGLQEWGKLSNYLEHLQGWIIVFRTWFGAARASFLRSTMLELISSCENLEG